MTTTIWISPTGNDTNPGTPNQPKRTFKACYAALPNGGTIRLHEGTYHASDTGPLTPPPGINIVRTNTEPTEKP